MSGSGKTMEESAASEFKGGFVAGTQVWTDKGHLPIEQLQAGDRALIGWEKDSQPIYDVVTDIETVDDQPIYSVRCCDVGDQAQTYNVYCSDSAQIWSDENGFCPSHLLEGGETQALAVRREGAVIEAVRIRETSNPAIGWEPEYGHSVVGWKIDFAHGFNSVGSEYPIYSWESVDSFRTRVYAIHTQSGDSYYVSGLGLRVR
jgi:hypothetical protein